jgi:hypothetical protein
MGKKISALYCDHPRHVATVVGATVPCSHPCSHPALSMSSQAQRVEASLIAFCAPETTKHSISSNVSWVIAVQCTDLLAHAALQLVDGCSQCDLRSTAADARKKVALCFARIIK